MKRNLHTSNQYSSLNPSTFFKSVLLLVAILISALTSKATTDTIPAILQSPTKFGGCIDTIFTLTYNSHHQHVLKIQTSLQNADSNCATSSGKPQLFIKVESSSISLANFKTDTLTGTLYCNVDSANQTVYIRYKVFIDCSILNPTNDSVSINKNLLQHFTDTTGYYFFNVNSNGNIATYTGIISPKIISNISNSTQTYFSNYLEKNYITFVYTNYNIDAHIKFRFYPGDTTLCGHGTTLGYEYKTDSMSNFVVFNPATNIATVIPANGFLYIRQTVTDINCWVKNDTCNSTATLQWQCNLPIPDTLFCSACLNNVETDYTIESNDAPKVILKTLSPASNATSDFNCFNDTVNMTSWSYLVVHDSLSYGAADTVQVFIGLHNSNISKINLTIIPKSSITIYKSNPLITIDTTFYHSATAPLCQNYINDSIYAMSFLFNQFKHGDTIIVSFKSFKCAEENDAALLGKPKILNQWEVYARAYSICKSWQPYYGGAISYESFSGYSDFHQYLDFSPATNNLSVLADSIYGDSLLLQIHLKGLTTRPDSYTIQYLGCELYDSTSSCPPHGLIRARIYVGTGLHISHPDSLVYFLIDTGANPVYIFADYYNTTVIPFDTCMKGFYYFYFPITKQLLYALNYGNFECVVQACCADTTNDEPVAAQIAFHLMPDPNDSCNNISFPFPANHIDPPSYGNVYAAYIPLSATGAQIHVHCPGCKAPGLIADRYSIRRINLGLQDSDNDGIADFPEKQIGSDSTWYAQNKKHLETNTSSYGDKLQDFLIAHFQDGSATAKNNKPGGYTYYMMKAKGALLKYLQIATLIPDSQNAFGLTPTSLNFYIDELDIVNPNCKDCNIFEADTNFRTKLHIQVPQDSLAQFLIQDSTTFFYTFSTDDTSTYYLLNSSFITYFDTISPFSTFEVDQRYRMTVSYDECKYFNAGPTPSLETAKRSCEITLHNWLSGIPQPINAFGLGIDMPNDTILLDSAGWTFNQSYHPLDSLVNKQFANTHIFYCEFNGTVHYFYSQDMYFYAAYESTYIDCNMNLRVRTTSATAGALPQLHTYPYEFRPPSLFPKSYNLFIQPGYTPIKATINNRVWVNGQCYGFLCPSKQITIPFPTAINNYMFFDSLPDAKCFNESNVSGLANDTNAYMQNDLTVREFTILLAPDSCTSVINIDDDSAFISIGGFPSLSCIQFATCNDSIIFKNEPPFHNINKSKPNLIVSFTPINNTVTKHRLSWRVKIENPSIIVDSIGGSAFYTTVATNVYLQAPALSILSNWTFKNDDSTNVNLPYSGNLFKLRNYLSVDFQINGTISCDYSPCADSAIVEFITGYNCDSFPTTPLDTNNVCQAILKTVKFNDAVSQISSGNIPDISFGLCKDFECSVNFSLSNQGDVFADSILISGLATGINVVSVAIKNCNNDSIISLTSNSNNHWYITLQNMFDTGFTDSLLVDTTNQNCIQIITTLSADCNFKSGFSNNNIIFFGHNFCGNVMSDTVQGFNFNYNDSNFCNDCFSISKIASTDTIIVGDTITYTITACANNQYAQLIRVLDSIPPNFNITSTSPPLPYAGLIGADTCLTFIIKGVFSKSNYDSCFNNVAWLRDSVNHVWHQDDTCIKVMPPCYLTGMVIIDNNTFSSTLATTTNTIFYVDSTLIIDTNTTFTNCTLYVATGGSIVVMPGDTLTLDSSSVEGCGYMWQGLKIDTTAFIYSRHSRIRDGNAGITMKKSGGFYVDSSQVIDCVKGIYVPPLSCGDSSLVFGYVSGTTFGLERTAFLPNYSTQPSHGILPKAGIDVSDVTNVYFGNNSAKKNFFHNMNIGIIGYRSDIDLFNSVFRNISVDTYYTEDYGGTAIVSLGQQSGCHINGDIIIHQVPNGDTLAKNIYRGVFTRYSNLSISNNKIINSTVGIYSTNTSDLLTAIVSHCYIQASYRGINWYGNDGAYYMSADADTIVMKGDTLGIGIKLTEGNLTANHRIENNVIITEGKFGIDAVDVLKPFIGNNKIKYNRIGSSATAIFRGISLDGCDSSTVTCNTVEGNTVTDTMKVGIWNRISNICTFSCNNVDSTGWGIYFGGVNMKTDFKGNTMKDHFIGLQLNNAAVTDTQTHAGNRWIGNYGSYGAKNYNAVPTSKVKLSLFEVDTSDATLLPQTPTSAPNNTQWFSIIPGAAFECTGSFDCESYGSLTEGSSELRMSIAKGDTITSEYIDESSNMAEQFLFSDLKNDSVKLANDTVLQNFVNVNENGAIGYLYKTKKKIQSSTEYDSAFLISILQIDSLRKIYSDSIHYLDLFGNSNSVLQRFNLINQLNYFKHQRQNLFQARQANVLSKLSDAKSLNNQVLPTQLPEDNEKFINDIQIKYKLGGKDSIAPFYSQILSIGEQCPYIGGKPVFRARGFVSLFDDKIQFDDYNTCLLQGIFREPNTIQNATESLDIKVIPNPASDKAELIIESSFRGICHLKIRDVLGKLIFAKQLDCNIKKHILDLHSIVTGVYFIQVDVEEKLKSVTKLVIIK